MKVHKKCVVLCLILFNVFFQSSCVPDQREDDDVVVRESFLAELNDDSSNPASRYLKTAQIQVEIKGKNGSSVDNLSAIIHVPETNTFFGLRNNDNYIHEMDANFNVIRDIKIKSFGGDSDLEGMAYLRSTAEGVEVAMVNEDASLFIGVIPFKATSIERKNFKKIILAEGDFGNEGPEGLCFDIQRQIFFVAFEGEGDNKSTRLIAFAMPKAITDGMDISGEVVEPFDIVKATKARDIADIALDPATGHLIALSEVERKIYELDITGQIYGHQTLDQDVQYEGLIVRGDNLQLVLAAEPNIIHAFNK